FVFSTYKREKLIISDALKDLRSNRFDIKVLEKASGEEVNPQTLEFLIDYIFKLKPFHALLRKIAFTMTETDVYNVQDMCVGGDVLEREGTKIGELQVPPPIDP